MRVVAALLASPLVADAIPKATALVLLWLGVVELLFVWMPRAL